MLIAVLTVILSALGSLLSISAGDGNFRITLGIVVLISALHLFKPKHPVLLAFATGLAVILLRIFVDSSSIPMNATLASSYFLEIFFYVGYAFIYNWAITTNTSPYPLPLVVALVLCDTGSNTIEYSLRTLAANSAWVSTSFYTIILAAMVRSVLIVLLVWIGQVVLRKKSA